MSRKQGPREAGMRPSAIAAGRRCNAMGIFSEKIGGDSMTARCIATGCGAGLPSGYAGANRKRGTRAGRIWSDGIYGQMDLLIRVLIEANHGY